MKLAWVTFLKNETFWTNNDTRRKYVFVNKYFLHSNKLERTDCLSPTIAIFNLTVT